MADTEKPASEQPTNASQEPVSPAPVKRKGRRTDIIAVVVIMLVVIGAAAFQEQIGAFFSMRQWDKGAPQRVVSEFLKAGKKGDKAAADKHIGSPDLHELKIDGKWVGYYVEAQGNILHLIMDELAPDGEPQPGEVTFNTIGGAAELETPDAKGKPVKYRLKMDNGWKINEILGGRPPKK